MKKPILFAMLGATLLAAGCNVGNAPAGMSADEAKANFEKASAEEQIKMIQGSPAPPDEKARRIAEIRKKAGLPEPDPKEAAGGTNFPGDPRSGGQ